MSLKKDKQKVLGEHFDDDRIRTFFDYEPYDETNPDYHVLEKAYRGMIAENFTTFVSFFKEQGRDINARNLQGKTFLQTISSHTQSKEYIDVLTDAGAQWAKILL